MLPQETDFKEENEKSPKIGKLEVKVKESLLISENRMSLNVVCETSSCWCEHVTSADEGKVCTLATGVL